MRKANTTISEVKIRGSRTYRLTYPTAAGRKREHFTKETDAQKRMKEIQFEQKQFGQSASAMTSTTRADAVAAEKILAGTGWTLVEAARFLLDHKQRERSGKPIEEAAALFLLSRNDTSERHRKTITTRISYMVRFLAGQTTASVAVEDIQRLLDGLDRKPVTRDNYKRCMTSFFNWCMDPARKWCFSNPAAATAPIATGKVDVEILTPKDAAAILAGCDAAILPGVVIGMFCGLRAAEVDRLDWQALDIVQGHITIGSGIAKTGSRRVCPIPANAVAWLAPYARKTGSVMADNERNRNLWKLARVRAGFGPFWSQYKAVNAAQNDPATDKPKRGLRPWPANALRHSALSYKLALTPDLPRLAYESGNSPGAIQTHYNGLATEQAAKAFFSILPTVAENVRQFNAA